MMKAFIYGGSSFFKFSLKNYLLLAVLGFLGSWAFLQLQQVRATLQLQLTGFSLQWLKHLPRHVGLGVRASVVAF